MAIFACFPFDDAGTRMTQEIKPLSENVMVSQTRFVHSQRAAQVS